MEKYVCIPCETDEWGEPYCHIPHTMAYTLYMATELYETGMLWVVLAIIFINTLSIIAGVLIVLMFHGARRRQATFLRELFNSDRDIKDAQLSALPPILWVYILLTAGVTLASILLFVFQPHWL